MTRAVLGGLAVAALATPAAAQIATPPTAPPLGAPTREEVQRAAPPAQVERAPRLTVEGGIERAPCPLDQPRFQSLTFRLEGVTFDNLRGLPAEALKPAYASLIGQTVPISVICEIRDAAATILRREGYVAAVQVPPQQISGGVVRFDVLMAKLVALRVRGNLGPSEKLVATYLEKLKRDEVFNERAAERYLLLARDLPGYDVRLTLRPAGTVPGEVVGEVTAIRQPINIDVNVQNYGSRQVGRFGALATASVNDLVGLGDRLTLGLFNSLQTKEQTVLQAGYDMRLGGEGFTLGGRFTYAWTRPDLGPVDPLTSRTLVASLEASYPFVRRQTSNLRLAGGVDLVNQTLRFRGIPLTRDRLRVGYLRLDADATDRASLAGRGGYSIGEPRWRLAGSLEARRGLGVFDSSDDCGPAPLYARCRALSLSRIEGDPTATLVRLTGQVEYRPTPKVALVLSPRAQIAFDPLLSYEEFSAGSYTVGRGYDPGTLVGDSGVGASAEVRLFSLAPRTRQDLVFQPYAFLDAAWVWNKRPPIPVNDPERLVSAGGGVRFVYGDHARLDVSLAKQLDRTRLQAKRGDVRFLVSLSTRLIPWSN